MARPIKYKPEMCGIALKVLMDGESLAAVCCELDITRETLRVWRETYPDLNESINKGLQHSQRVWEQIGRDGIVGSYEKFNGAPWMFTMKNRFREDYKEDKEPKTVSDTIVEKLIDKLIDS